MKKIIGIGETVLDIIFKNDQPIKAVPGGSTFNAIISVGRTGTPCTIITETGDDHVGEITSRFLLENNVDNGYVLRHEGTQSHVSLAFLNDRNDAQYSFYKHHGELSMPDEMPEINAGDIVIFGSFYAINPKIRQYTRRFLEMARGNGAILYYDINFRASHIKELPQTYDNIIENFRLASVVRGSAEDFSILFDLYTGKDVYDKLKEYCPHFIYTDADKPIQLFTPTIEKQYAVNQIQTVSTIGAGDNFNAGFCYGLYQNGVANIDELTEELWDSAISQGQEFSEEVCQSMDNYIAPRKEKMKN